MSSRKGFGQTPSFGEDRVDGQGSALQMDNGVECKTLPKDILLYSMMYFIAFAIYMKTQNEKFWCLQEKALARLLPSGKIGRTDRAPHCRWTTVWNARPCPKTYCYTLWCFLLIYMRNTKLLTFWCHTILCFNAEMLSLFIRYLFCNQKTL